MKKVSNLIIAFFSLIALSFLASCSNVNVNSEPSLIIQLPGGNIGKAVTSGDITWYEVSVTNDFRSYSGSGAAGSIIEIERVVAGTYTVTCNGKKNKDDIVAFFTDSKVVNVGPGENVVDLALGQKYNGAGYVLIGYSTGIKYYDTELIIRSPQPNTSGSYAFDNNGDIYYLRNSDPYGMSKLTSTGSETINNFSSSIMPDNAKNRVYGYSKMKMDFRVFPYFLEGYSSTEETSVNCRRIEFADSTDYYPSFDNTLSCINNNKIYLLRASDSGAMTGENYYLLTFDIPDNITETITLYVDKSYSSKIKIFDYIPKLQSDEYFYINDILVKDNSIYFLGYYSISYLNTFTRGIVVKFNIGPSGIPSFAGYTGYCTDTKTELPATNNGQIITYNDPTDGFKAKKLFYTVDTPVPYLNNTNDSKYLYNPSKFAASLPGYLAIADSGYYVFEQNQELKYTSTNRIMYLNLENFSITGSVKSPVELTRDSRDYDCGIKAKTITKNDLPDNIKNAPGLENVTNIIVGYYCDKSKYVEIP